MKIAAADLNWNNKALFRLLWPLVVEQLLGVTMGLADTVMVSSVGEHAVSGVSLVDMINQVLIMAFAALATGGAVVVSQFIGRKDNANAGLASRQLIYSSTAVAVVLMVFTLFLRFPILRLVYGSIDQDVMNGAMIYFLVTALSYPFLAIYNSSAALFRAAGNSKVTMHIALLVNILNIGGNAVLIFVFHLGTLGVGLSTLVSRIAAAVVLTVMLTNTRSAVSLKGLFKIKLSPRLIRSILNVGIPSGLESSMFQVGRLLVTRIFTTFGTAAIAANAITSVINSASFMPGSAYGIALLTVVGQCIGAKNTEAARYYTAKIMKITYSTLIIFSILIFTFMEPLVGAFHLSPAAHDMAKSFLNVHCFTMAFLWASSFALPNALRAAGDVRYVMITAIASMWTCRVSIAYILSYGLKLGPIGVWYAMGADFAVRNVCYISRWLSGRWKEHRVIEE
ncbi:MAG: MATE family efflux transporter [Treponema sp.]|nr:MATE family efflux transporter [Treponema sp.]